MHSIDRKEQLVDVCEPECEKERLMRMMKKEISLSHPHAARGFVPLYHADTVNHCPGCGQTHWHIGRSTAECAFCDTAIPLASTNTQPVRPLFWFRGSETLAVA